MISIGGRASYPSALLSPAARRLLPVKGVSVANGYYFFPGDYVRDTLHLGWLEDLAYRRLLDLYYSRARPIVNDRGYIMRAVRASEPEHQAAVDTILAEFFVLEVDGWHQQKADERLAIERNRSEGGKRGAEARWHKNKQLADSKPLASHSLANAPFPSLPIPKKVKSIVDTRVSTARPTVDEVTAYCRERGNRVDAQKWVDYYSSNGWKVGKNPMKDWRAAVRTWERNEVGSVAGGPAPRAARKCSACGAQGSLIEADRGPLCPDCYRVRT